MEPAGGVSVLSAGEVLCRIGGCARAHLWVCVFLVFETEFCFTTASLCSRAVFRRGDWVETELANPGVGARRGSGEEV